MQDKRYIYGLVEYGSTEIFYVGQTNDPKRRLSQHIALANVNSGNKKEKWIGELLESGKSLDMIILEECDNESAVDREAYWISQYGAGMNSQSRSGRAAGGGQFLPPSRKKVGKTVGFDLDLLEWLTNLGEGNHSLGVERAARRAGYEDDN